MQVSKLHPYVGFKDNAREAMTFYHAIFGGKLEIHPFGEYGGTGDPAEDDKVMHSMIDADNGISFMGADTPNSMEYNAGSTISMSLSGENEAELRGYWDKLSEGGTVTMPLASQAWGDTFGMVRDKYGLMWMVNIHAPEANPQTV